MTTVTGHDVALDFFHELFPIPQEPSELTDVSPTSFSIVDSFGARLDFTTDFGFNQSFGTITGIAASQDGVPIVEYGGLDIKIAAENQDDDDLFGQFGTIFDGPDRITGSTQSDSLFSLGGADDLRGGDGDDYADGGEGDDYVLGQLGNDGVFGDEGNDLLGGGGGDDFLDGEAGDDGLDGGDGNDILQGRDGNDRMIADDGADQVLGAAGDDLIGGGSGSDGLSGGDGNDIIDGSDNGNDAMAGGAGNDIMVLGIGDETASGGPGADLFILRVGGAGTDRVTDFFPGGGDLLRNDTGLATSVLIANATVSAEGTTLTLGEADTVVIAGATGIDTSWFVA